MCQGNSPSGIVLIWMNPLVIASEAKQSVSHEIATSLRSSQ